MITAVMQAWTPLFYQVLEQRGHHGHVEITRGITFLIVLFSFAGFGLALFSREIVAVMTRPAFHQAYHIVPVLVLYFLIGGINGLLINNIYFAGKTKWMSPVTVVSVLVIVPANLALVPRLGAAGAAVAAVLAALVYTTLDFIIAQRVYPMRFDYRAIAKIVCLAIGLFMLSLLVEAAPVLERLALKAGLAALFPLGLLALGVMDRHDLQAIQRVGREVLTHRSS
jgi:O-antigen/teichoic acid export membrane protein